MKIEHVAIWVADIEQSKTFYMTYFGMTSSEKYVNDKKQFSSYFLSFGEGRSRIELMHNPAIMNSREDRSKIFGWTHLAISVGDEKAVNELTERLRSDGYTIVGEPRTTGDDYYESVILDPEGNEIEITT